MGILHYPNKNTVHISNQKRFLLAAVQNAYVGHSFDKFDTIDASEQILVITEAPNYSLWKRVNGISAMNQFKNELCFVALCCTEHHAR